MIDISRSAIDDCYGVLPRAAISLHDLRQAISPIRSI